MARQSYQIPIRQPATEDGFKRLATSLVDAATALFQGRTNAAGDLALTAGTSTVLAHPFIHENSVILFMPKSSAAAALQSSIYVTAGNKTATITHATAAGGEAFSWIAAG